MACPGLGLKAFPGLFPKDGNISCIAGNLILGVLRCLLAGGSAGIRPGAL